MQNWAGDEGLGFSDQSSDRLDPQNHPWRSFVDTVDSWFWQTRNKLIKAMLFFFISWGVFSKHDVMKFVLPVVTIAICSWHILLIWFLTARGKGFKNVKFFLSSEVVMSRMWFSIHFEISGVSAIGCYWAIWGIWEKTQLTSNPIIEGCASTDRLHPSSIWRQ